MSNTFPEIRTDWRKCPVCGCLWPYPPEMSNMVCWKCKLQNNKSYLPTIAIYISIISVVFSSIAIFGSFAIFLILWW